ncbi:MAG: DnaJ domain-containing protein [Desulfobacterales bacterium]|nr:DnaJ domain-containing protein [Desulfobacterales bacterium]
MFVYYLILNADLNASDDDIRKSYIELVKKYPPEKEPVKFQQITEAYEAIKDKRSRINQKLFGSNKTSNYEHLLNLIKDSIQAKRKRVGLKEIFKAQKK